jgi:far upstream element-binding protein
MSATTGGTSAEEAAAKAKEIAARSISNAAGRGGGISSVLTHPTTTNNSVASTNVTAATTTTVTPTFATSSITTERKRKRWGTAPPVEVIPGLAEAAKKKQQLSKGNSPEKPSSKRIWISVSAEKPETHFYSYLKERLPELCAKINNDGFNGNEGNKLELAGRGATDKPPLPGMPLEPMHIMIHGSSDDFIQVAAPKVEELLAEAEQAEREGPPPDPCETARLLQSSGSSSTDYSSALTLTRPYRSDTLAQNASRQSGYKPATVAQLISNNPNVLNPTLGASEEDLIEESMNVPNSLVGFVIGRGGETISSMQARSGCKVQIQKEHELQPGQTHRVITLQATSQDSIDQCRRMIEAMVQERSKAMGGANSRDNRESSNNGSVDAKVSEALAAGHALVKVDVPDADVGLIIGKGGTTIKNIQDSTESSIQIPQTGNPDDPSIRTISITSPTEAGALAAKVHIENLLKSKPSYAAHTSTNTSSQSTTAGPAQQTIQVLIPDKDVGLCIGRQGCVIREMQVKTGTKIQIPSHPTPGQIHRVATITGTQEGCSQAQALIDRIVTEQTSACVMSGTPYNNNNREGGYHQYHQGNPYSNNSQNQEETQRSDPAWAAYYAAQALALKQQQQQQEVNSASTGSEAADAYYEQFFRYAYYYGEVAARQYYGSWSPPVGTPNPYGVNPNPSPPPTSNEGNLAPGGSYASQASMENPSHSTVGAVRDSSVRKVSNLPAWMTQS